MIPYQRALRGSALLLGFFLLGTSSLLSEEPTAPAVAPASTTLETTTVVANRLAVPLARSGSAVTVLDGETLEQAQLQRLEEALRRSPGVFSESTGGQRGSINSLFLRGTSTSQTHLQVDGIRLSDSTVSTNNFLGNATLGGVDQIEILRGPQSALYGGESIGGMVGITSRRGEGDPQAHWLTEGGSFNSLFSQAAASGAFDNGFAYALNLGWEQTDNDPQGTPNLDHEQLSYALRLDYEISPHARVGLTFRGGHAEFNDTYGGENFTDYQLVTAFGSLDLNEHWTSTLRFGVYNEAYDFGDPSTFATDAEKISLNWENEVRFGENDAHATAFGALLEQTDFAQDFSFPADRDQYGVYANHVWQVTDSLTISGGVRWEDYDDYGDEFTWRTTAAYHLPATGTTFRASYGTGFRTPSLLELNGGPFEAGNPSLSPEESEGWDLGITQALGDSHALSLTWFENEIENLIVDPFGALPYNTSGKGNANGLELGFEGHALDQTLRYGLAYTYLDRSLVGLPENVIDAHLHWEATDQLGLGLGIAFVDDRDLGGDALDEYVTARIYGSYAFNDHLSLHARLENAFDERYEHASFGGVPVAARRLGAFAGLTLKW